MRIWGINGFALSHAIIERLKALGLWEMVTSMLFSRGGVPDMVAASVERDGVMQLGFRLGDGSIMTVMATEDGTLTTTEEDRQCMR